VNAEISFVERLPEIGKRETKHEGLQLFVAMGNVEGLLVFWRN
jgi:hypothetical protein